MMLKINVFIECRFHTLNWYSSNLADTFSCFGGWDGDDLTSETEF